MLFGQIGTVKGCKIIHEVNRFLYLYIDLEPDLEKWEARDPDLKPDLTTRRPVLIKLAQQGVLC